MVNARRNGESSSNSYKGFTVNSIGMLEGKSKVYKHPKGKTLYVTIPSDVAMDSKFPLKNGMIVTVKIQENMITIEEVKK